MQPPHAMPSERQTTLYLNGAELLRIQTTPVDLADWAIGFLYTEGIIDGPADLYSLAADPDALAVRAEVAPDRLPDRDLATRRYLTSGCGKGVTFSSMQDRLQLRPVEHDLTVARTQLVEWIKRMQQQSPLYAATGGMHAAAALQVPTGAMLVREDIGRHNAVDKAIGAALQAGWRAEETVLLTTGRISYEMCAKLGRARIGIGASISAATDQAIRLAERLAIDLAGYARTPAKLVVYTAGHRII